jgi:hypothetical protein
MEINYGYNLREKANQIAGAVIGAAIPIVLVKYQMSSLGLETNTIGQEAIAWFNATLASTPLQLISAYAGYCAGIISSGDLRKARLDRELGRGRTKESSIENRINSDGLLEIL